MHRSADMINAAAEAAKGAADSVLSVNEKAPGNLQTQPNVSDKTTNPPVDPLAAVGNIITSGGDDDETYPGLEKPFVKQQELK